VSGSAGRRDRFDLLRHWNPDLSSREPALLGSGAQHGYNHTSGHPVRQPIRDGMVMDQDLQEVLDHEIAALDHRDLNRDTPYFGRSRPRRRTRGPIRCPLAA
jgi:hypothetical protein